MTSRSRRVAVPPWRDGDAPLSARGWRTAVVVWHLVVAAMAGTALVRAAVVVDPDRGPRPVLVGALLALVVGWVVLGASLVTCAVGQGWAMGTVLWCGVLSAAAGLLVLMIPYAVRIVAAAGILMLAGALVMLCAAVTGTGPGRSLRATMPLAVVVENHTH